MQEFQLLTYAEKDSFAYRIRVTYQIKDIFPTIEEYDKALAYLKKEYEFSNEHLIIQEELIDNRNGTKIFERII